MRGVACQYRVVPVVGLVQLDGAVVFSFSSWQVFRTAPNKSLQRSGTHKVLGRGRPSVKRTRALRARVLKGRRAVAELGR